MVQQWSVKGRGNGMEATEEKKKYAKRNGMVREGVLT